MPLMAQGFTMGLIKCEEECARAAMPYFVLCQYFANATAIILYACAMPAQALLVVLIVVAAAQVYPIPFYLSLIAESVWWWLLHMSFHPLLLQFEFQNLTLHAT